MGSETGMVLVREFDESGLIFLSLNFLAYGMYTDQSS